MSILNSLDVECQQFIDSILLSGVWKPLSTYHGVANLIRSRLGLTYKDPVAGVPQNITEHPEYLNIINFLNYRNDSSLIALLYITMCSFLAFIDKKNNQFGIVLNMIDLNLRIQEYYYDKTVLITG